MPKTTQEFTYKLALALSNTNAVPLTVRAVPINTAIILDGDLQEAVHVAMAYGLIRYFPKAQLYGVLLLAYELPGNPYSWWLFADLYNPGAYHLKPSSFAKTDPPSRLTTADVALHLIQECLDEAETNGLDRSSWSLDQWLNWQKQVVLDESVGLCIDQIQHTHAPGMTDAEGNYTPPHSTGFSILFKDGSILLLTGTGPEVPESGIHYVREVRPGETEPTYRAVSVAFGVWGTA